jgi:inorganic pyrophosphatase
MQNNPWHSVNVGNSIPSFVNAVIEIPKGSKAKYELDKSSGLLKMERVLFSSLHYPVNYGFIPQTFCEDGDPLDILVICSIDVEPMCIIEAKVIGVMRMLDEEDYDDKIIAVAKNDLSVSNINNIEELPPHIVVELRRFFEDYKKLGNKKTIADGFLGKEQAYKIIDESIALYSKTAFTY